MVNLSPEATTKLHGLLQEKGLHGYGLRVFVSGGGCGGMQYGMAFDEQARQGDEVSEAGGMQVFIDAMSAPYLDGANIEYVDSLMGGGFKIENPNAVSTCSCGQSFRTEGDKVNSTCSH